MNDQVPPMRVTNILLGLLLAANLPEVRGGHWGQGLTAEKMKECHWLTPVLVGQFEYVEWTPDNHLRHSRFVAGQAATCV